MTLDSRQIRGIRLVRSESSAQKSTLSWDYVVPPQGLEP